jgi:hypothetical protein
MYFLRYTQAQIIDLPMSAVGMRLALNPAQ